MSQTRQGAAIETPARMEPVGAEARVAGSIPPRAGVGLKAEHYETIIENKPDIGWLEIHAENYMGAGGPPHRYLSAVREHYPLSVHGVGMSIGAERPLDLDHLARLKAVVERYEPGLFSEHLCWSTHGSVFDSDLLPVPYTEDAVKRVVEHIEQIQEAVGRRLLLENPLTYLVFVESTMTEIDFLAEVARRSGCGLLLDVNNVLVSATNQQWDPIAYINAFPIELVGEIHLGGRAPIADDNGDPLLIDAHDGPVADPAWSLYERALGRAGPVPTLIEWDNEVPAWEVLSAEAARADAVLAAHASKNRRHAIAG